MRKTLVNQQKVNEVASGHLETLVNQHPETDSGILPEGTKIVRTPEVKAFGKALIKGFPKDF